MKVLLVTDSAVLRRSVAQAAVDRGHDVRALTRADDRPPTHWPARVEPWPAALGDVNAVLEASTGCDAAILIDDRLARMGTPEGDPAAFTTKAVNALGDRGVRTLLALPRALDERSEPAANQPSSLRIRCDGVYGTGEDAVSVFLIMMRTLPAVPLLSATHPLRPLWHEDLARGLAAAVAFESPARTLDFTAAESTTYDALYERLAALIDRRPVRLPIPDFVAAHGARLADVLHLPVPFDAAMLGAPAPPASVPDGLTLLGVERTGLELGLRRLATGLPEMVPSEGVGRLEVKRFFAEITATPHTAPELLRLMRSRFGEVMPIPVGVEPVSPLTSLEPGAVITMNLPARGHLQIRVVSVAEDHVAGVTLKGHALAGCVRFSAAPTARGIRFEVMTCESASNTFDWLTLCLGGGRLQDANWKSVVENVVKMSGGQAEKVQSDGRRLTSAEAEQADRWIRELVEAPAPAAPPLQEPKSAPH